MRHLRKPSLAALTVAVLALCSSLDAQGEFTLTAGSASGLPGSSISIPVMMDSTLPSRGASFGVTFDPSVATLDGVDQGATLLSYNGGGGADYFFVDTDPVGGPGGVVAFIISLSAPIEDLPVATGLELTLLNFDVSPTAPFGPSSVDFSAALGDPPVPVVASVAGVSYVPTQVSGEIGVEVPSPNNLACSLSDACVCEFTATWTNPVLYDSIDVTLDGAVVATLAGDATSTMVSLSGPGMGELCVIGNVTSESSSPTCCTLDCPSIPPALPPQDLVCSNDGTCLITLTWTNPETYTSIDLYIDGAFSVALAGDAETTTVDLGGTEGGELCLRATEVCGAVLADVCCSVSCGDLFRRADANGDAMINIADAISILDFLFASVPTDCLIALDGNDDNGVDIGDAVYVLSFLFSMGTPPAAPFPDCGLDLTPGAPPLSCDVPSCP